jgi:hypothetical protein
MSALREFVADLLDGEGALVEPVERDGLEVMARMTEVLPQPVVLTTDSDFRVYRSQRPAGGTLRVALTAAARTRAAGMP